MVEIGGAWQGYITFVDDLQDYLVFSEVYYPGWTATIDGQPAEVGRANYVLRALNVPSGKHEVVLSFKPQSIQITETIAYIALAVLALLIVAGIVLKLRTKRFSE